MVIGESLVYSDVLTLITAPLYSGAQNVHKITHRGKENTQKETT